VKDVGWKELQWQAGHTLPTPKVPRRQRIAFSRMKSFFIRITGSGATDQDVDRRGGRQRDRIRLPRTPPLAILSKVQRRARDEREACSREPELMDGSKERRSCMQRWRRAPLDRRGVRRSTVGAGPKGSRRSRWDINLIASRKARSRGEGRPRSAEAAANRFGTPVILIMKFDKVEVEDYSSIYIFIITPQ
jgi:hypothetical protein